MSTTMKLPQEFYNRKADEVAQDLLGRYLIMVKPSGGHLYVCLREIGAYEGCTRTTSKDIKHLPGIVTLSVKMGQRLIDISTKQGKDPSCITLRAGDIYWGSRIEPVQGPGNLAKRLGITKETEGFYQCQEIYGNKLWIEGEPISRMEIQERTKNSPNCLGIFYY